MVFIGEYYRDFMDPPYIIRYFWLVSYSVSARCRDVGWVFATLHSLHSLHCGVEKCRFSCIFVKKCLFLSKIQGKMTKL